MDRHLSRKDYYGLYSQDCDESITRRRSKSLSHARHNDYEPYDQQMEGQYGRNFGRKRSNSYSDEKSLAYDHRIAWEYENQQPRETTRPLRHHRAPAPTDEYRRQPATSRHHSVSHRAKKPQSYKASSKGSNIRHQTSHSSSKSGTRKSSILIPAVRAAGFSQEDPETFPYPEAQYRTRGKSQVSDPSIERVRASAGTDKKHVRIFFIFWIYVLSFAP